MKTTDIWTKKLILAAACAALILNLQACSSQQPEKDSPLSLMEQVNRSNILHADPACRIWYEVDPSFFADSDANGSGDLQGLISYINYLSDSDINTRQDDLNMSGIFLDNVLSTDASGTPVEYLKLARTLGSDDDLADLCSQANAAGLAVMIPMDLTALSQESSLFKQLVTELEDWTSEHGNSDPDAAIASLSYDVADVFLLSTTKGSDRYEIGKTGVYYQGLNGSDIPDINQDSKSWRVLIEQAVWHYLSLGVSGFHIGNIQDLYSGSPAKSVEFANWFTEMVHSMDPDAYVIGAANTFFEQLSDAEFIVADASASGADGYIAKAVTQTISAKELGEILSKQAKEYTDAAVFLNNESNSIDLLKSTSREAQLKEALALQLMMSGQVFLCAGDEIGLSNDEFDLIASILEQETMEEEGPAARTFGSLAEQKQDGSSIFNFIQQAILLRNAYAAISSGSLEVRSDLCTDSLLVIDKKNGSSEIMLLFNLSPDPISVDVSKVTLMGLPAELGGVLLTDSEPAELENGTLSMPGCSMVLLK